MKKLFIFISLFIFCATTYAQNNLGRGFNFQAVARTADGNNLRIDDTVKVKFTFLRNSTATIAEYEETVTLTTDMFGTFATVIGKNTKATSSPAFTTLDFQKNDYWLKIEIWDNSKWNIMSTQVFYSTPYAEFTKKAIKSDTAVYAINAKTAVTTSGYANNAYLADRALKADMTTGNAKTATVSDTAKYAKYALNAGTAVTTSGYVNNAYIADRALKADMTTGNAKTATVSDTAKYAKYALNAGTAANTTGKVANATYADNAGTAANTTGNAATANKATFATTAGNGVPIGTIIAYAGTTLPADWLWCDGSSFSTTAYPELYNAIKYSWGGSGSSFNLPDLRGLFMRGNQNMKNSNDRPPATHDPDGNGRTLGSYQDDAFQGHGHRFSTPMNQANQQTSGSSGTARIYAEGLNDTWDVLTIVSGSHGTPRYTTETRPKNVYVNYIIKAK